LLDGARSAAKFVVFDACRNELQLPTIDTSKGLIPVAEQEGLFVAYASSPGRTASDRGDSSGSASGFIAQGPPNRFTISQYPANISIFKGLITSEGLKFEDMWHQKYIFATYGDGQMAGTIFTKKGLGTITIEQIN
jgi:hypothetical protein